MCPEGNRGAAGLTCSHQEIIDQNTSSHQEIIDQSIPVSKKLLTVNNSILII